MRDDGTNVGIGVDPAGYKLRVYGPVRGSSFTDEENTGYYVDPASTSSMNAVYTNALYYSNIYLNGNSAYGFKGSSVYADTINTGSSGDPLELNYVNSGPVTTADMRADIFYDRSNTAYYVDPDGNTRLAGNVGIGTAPGSWKLKAVGGAYGIAGYGTNTGVLGYSYDNNGVGVKGFVYSYYSKGVYGYSTYGDAYGSYAGYFQGDVKITGKLILNYNNCQDIAVSAFRVTCPTGMVVRGVVTGTDGWIPDITTLICCNQI
jgi:hypothetical protein